MLCNILALLDLSKVVACLKVGVSVLVVPEDRYQVFLSEGYAIKMDITTSTILLESFYRLFGA